MFSTFRRRLLFWFLVFISFNIIFILLTAVYLQQRENISSATSLIEFSYLSLLQKVVAQQSFLSYDTKNPQFFESGESRYLERSQRMSDSTLHFMEAAEKAIAGSSPVIANELSTLKQEIWSIDYLFDGIVEKIKERGFKDYMLEGEMREDVHWLEEIPEIPNADILMLRRHEKDFIIRNERKYVDQLNVLVSQIEASITENKRLSSERKETIIQRLNGYQNKFNLLVGLEVQIGIKDNTGLKLELDKRIQQLADNFDILVLASRNRKNELYYQLNVFFGILLLLLFGGSLWLSYLISTRITTPLKELTFYITRFVDSNFTLSERNPRVRSKDEIGKLTENFSILKDEIINRLQFFKEKVAERTAELATANQRLSNLNKANRRFVPQEFLHFLGKETIEEVNLGDYIQEEMTVLFTDIRSFTQISETLSPQENFDFLNNYLKVIVPVIQKHHGIIDKYIGDSIMALFPKGPEWALRAALAFNPALRAFNANQQAAGKVTVRIGTGIHTGQLILGTIGHEQRLDTTVISDAVNIASRVEGLTRFYKAKSIVTEGTLSKLPKGHPFDYRFLDFVKVKGKSKELSIYELIGPNEKVKLSYQENYRLGVALMRNRNIDRAAQVFEQIVQLNPADEVVNVILKRCQYYQEHGLPENWDGIERMLEK